MYAWVQDALPSDKRDQWITELYSPLPGMSADRVGPETASEEMGLFKAFAGTR